MKFIDTYNSEVSRFSVETAARVTSVSVGISRFSENLRKEQKELFICALITVSTRSENNITWKTRQKRIGRTAVVSPWVSWFWELHRSVTRGPSSFGIPSCSYGRYTVYNAVMGCYVFDERCKSLSFVVYTFFFLLFCHSHFITWLILLRLKTFCYCC